MSYICEHTGVLVPNNTPEHRVVIKTRPKQYEVRIKRGPNRGSYETVQGWEIVKEIRVSPDAYRELTGKEPRKRNPTPPRPVETFALNKPVEPWRNRKKKNNSSNQRNRKPVVQVLKRPKK